MLEHQIRAILMQYNAAPELQAALLSLFPQYLSEQSTVLSSRSAETWKPDNDNATYILNTRDNTVPPQSVRVDTDQNDRYDDLGVLGIGAMGEVKKVFDRSLQRSLAMKIIHPDLLAMSSASSRFTIEAQINAQLQHPNIVPVHDMGALPDGRLYFTMKEVKGKPLDYAIQEVHEAIENHQWQVTDTGWSFRRLIDAFSDVCKAVAFAHSKAVLHRDLKPENIMLGEYGEVLVVDWGIAKVLSQQQSAKYDEDMVVTGRPEIRRHSTRVGQVAGTPAYMSPEQAKGEIDKLDARTDVYALGAILYEILTGQPPYVGSNGLDILKQVRLGPPQSIQSVTTLPLPEELLIACERAMNRDITERYESANELVQVISDWLDGAKKREQALQVLNDAMSLTQRRSELEKRAQELQQEAEQGLKDIPKWEGEAVKGQWWEKQRQAQELQEQARMLNIIQEQQLQAALTHKSDLVEAHLELAKRYLQEHQLAENNRNLQDVTKAEIRLREHVEELPIQHPERLRLTAYLQGTGIVSITTDVPDVEVTLERFTNHHRRLIAKPIQDLGRTPINDHRIEMGSYLLRLQKEGCHDVCYPFSIERGQHWNGIDPQGKQHQIQIPLLGQITEHECYVPGGWYWAGSENESALPRKRVWVNSFVIKKYPVTNREYLLFLDDLVANNREEEALRWVPRERAAQAGQLGAMIYGRTKDGHFILVPDADGHIWNLDWPVMMIDYFSAVAYAEWYSQKQQLQWRLPHELEWEKSARGVDERSFVWGNGFDPSYACMRQSHSDEMLPAVVDRFPIDCSIYGVRGLAGNMMDWTSSLWAENWSKIDFVEGKVSVNSPSPNNGIRIIRGGSWGLDIKALETSHRGRYDPSRRSSYLGFRLCRSY